MLIDARNTGAHRLAIHRPSPISKVQGEIEVEIETLENLIVTNEIPQPEFLKIDAEGSEVDILEGLGKFITNVNAAVIEPDESNRERCEDILKNNGFRIYRTKPYLIWGVKK